MEFGIRADAWIRVRRQPWRLVRLQHPQRHCPVLQVIRREKLVSGRPDAGSCDAMHPVAAGGHLARAVLPLHAAVLPHQKFGSSIT